MKGLPMFITFLRFAANRAAAAEFISAHNEWIAKGFSDGVFLCVGSLAQAQGGAILAHGESLQNHEARIAADPFVVQGIVAAETYEVDPKRTTDALNFLRVEA
jgi:uncharacterized protein YciI